MCPARMAKAPQYTLSPHMHTPPPNAAPASTMDQAERARGIQRVALVAALTNTLLALGQIVIGLMANAFSLVADAMHTLSDLITDVLVLFAGRRGADPADSNHPYGHGRIETVTSLLLGGALTTVGGGFLFASGQRLQHMDTLPELHPAALAMAVLTLIAKEVLFRYALAASRRLNAPLLESNAWHARSDAASSLVVAAGIGASLAGYPFLEPLAAALVGFLIGHMGIRLAWQAVRELIDTGLPEEEIARLRQTIITTPGVTGLHDLRTRRMANRVLCDAHVQVEPRITVSEGHRISDNVFFRVRAHHPEVQDLLVHVDPENDGSLHSTAAAALPDRGEILAAIRGLLGADHPPPDRLQIHYLGHRIEVEVFLPPDGRADAADALRERTSAWLANNPMFRKITFFVQIAP